MKKTVCVCDHCGAEFNPINGYSDLELNDLDFVKEVDLCTECFNELCDVIREFIREDSWWNTSFKVEN